MKRMLSVLVLVLLSAAMFSACDGGGGGGASYTVGGTVSGLTGAGLVLQNNGGDDLAVSANGAFTFETSVADGAGYIVTVKTQPTGPSQTCTASNNTGTIAGANVTDVSVVCSTNAYTVGGTVSGLSGSGLVLQNNGGDDLTITGNGSFTFATAVADGAGYTVTVKTQPTGPSQTCTSSSNTGTISGANVTNVSVVCSTNAYTVGGTVSGLSGSGLVLQNNIGDDLAVSANGAFTFSTKVASGAGYNVTVKTQPTNPGQKCVVGSGTGTVLGADVTNVSVSCAAFINLNTFQTASVVIGQPTFTASSANQGGAAGANTLSVPYGDPVVYNGILYLTDSSNERVLGFNSVPTSNNTSANFVLGEPNFTTTTGGTSDKLMIWPRTVRSYNGKLFVTDSANSRILIWNSVPTTTQAPANVVVGQVDFTSLVTGCTSTTLKYPESMFAVDGKLIVADSDNNRVLIWNSIPTSNGAAADIVLGQPNMNTCTAGTVSASSLNYPSDIWSDGVRLIITDSNNNRVLIWNTFPTTNQAPADIVLGQPNMNSNTAQALSDKSLIFPYFLTSNGSQLFVSENNNNRIVIWNSIPTTNYAPADRVLGQGDFVHNVSNDDNQDGVDDGNPTARTFYNPTGLFVFDDKLIVGDSYNNRYLIFQGQ